MKKPSLPLLCLTTILTLFVTVLASPARAQEAAADADRSETTAPVERAQNTIAILQPLLDLEKALEQQIGDLKEQATASEAEANAQAEELAGLQTELEDIQDQISVTVTGVSEKDYRSFDGKTFDLNTEFQNLVEPFVLVLNEATNDARQIERTRRALGIAQRRLEASTLAIENAEAALSQASDTDFASRFEQDLAAWQERQALHRSQIEALNQRIADLQAQRSSVGENVNSAFQVFFRDRGISLALGIGAFIGVLVLARLLTFLGQRSLGWYKGRRTFAMRLGSLLFAILAILLSFAAMLTVFNMRNDWLLMGLALFLLLAAVWVVLRMLPSLIEQLAALLNLGAVQENERVVFHGVPYKVQRLSFFTDLVNPALDGGEFTLPVRELVGMHSRPAAEDEAWFPSMKGDWVRLSDGHAGQVVAQTPEMVMIEMLGGARVTYQTAEYLAAAPQNLSHGFRAEVEFGIGYRHQKIATTEVIDIMRRGIADHFAGLLDPEDILGMDVELLRAGASSLDYEVEIDVAGRAASRFEELERELARCLVNLANDNDWEIPFQQLVIHRA